MASPSSTPASVGLRRDQAQRPAVARATPSRSAEMNAVSATTGDSATWAAEIGGCALDATSHTIDEQQQRQQHRPQREVPRGARVERAVGHEARDRGQRQPGQRRLAGHRGVGATLEVCREAGLDVRVTVGGGQVGVAGVPELVGAREARAQAGDAQQDAEAGRDGGEGRQQRGGEHPRELARHGIPAAGASDDLGGRPRDRVGRLASRPVAGLRRRGRGRGQRWVVGRPSSWVGVGLPVPFVFVGAGVVGAGPASSWAAPRSSSWTAAR